LKDAIAALQKLLQTAMADDGDGKDDTEPDADDEPDKKKAAKHALLAALRRAELADATLQFGTIH
jgi:hypothetical protein